MTRFLAALRGALWCIALSFPSAILLMIIWRFPIPFVGYRSGPGFLKESVWAVGFYGILGGFVLWGICLGIAKLVSNFSASSTTIATNAFIGIWFVAAAVNLWIGVSQAGYSFKEELPIFSLIFLLPAAVAALATPSAR